MQTSPSSPWFKILLLVSIIQTSGPAGIPTNPGFWDLGGKGFEVIWWVASVIPYASITGQLNTSFSFSNTAGGRDADDDLKNLRFNCLAVSRFLSALINIAWCIVGTPEYQVIFSLFALSKNFNALNPLLAHTDAPTFIDAARTAINPCMWNNGIIFRQWSLSVKLRLLEILSAEEKIFLFVNGTILGLDVVPEVCSTRASWSSPGKT